MKRLIVNKIYIDVPLFYLACVPHTRKTQFVNIYQRKLRVQKPDSIKNIWARLLRTQLLVKVSDWLHEVS